MTNPRIQVGCCGWQTSQAVYYRNFDVIEIDSSFYKLPMLKTALRWRQEAPADFTFLMKAWQVITHEPYSPTYPKGGLNLPPAQWKDYGSFRPTQVVFHAWDQTVAIAQALGCPIVLFQCPAQFTPTPEHIQNLRAFFTEIDRGGVLCAWEPRGQGWDPALTASLCQELDLIHCVDPFLAKPTWGSPRYFRLHGSADYTYQFTDQDLQLLQTWIATQDGYCMFNNVHMWEDSIRFRRLIGQIDTPKEENL